MVRPDVHVPRVGVSTEQVDVVQVGDIVESLDTDVAEARIAERDRSRVQLSRHLAL
jgi:hypothetical protein